MFNLGMGEILVLGIIALIVVGPEKLPGLARNVGRFINDIKRTTSDVTREISRSIDEQNFNKSNKSVEASEPQSVDPLMDVGDHNEEGHHDDFGHDEFDHDPQEDHLNAGSVDQENMENDQQLNLINDEAKKED